MGLGPPTQRLRDGMTEKPLVSTKPRGFLRREAFRSFSNARAFPHLAVGPFLCLAEVPPQPTSDGGLPRMSPSRANRGIDGESSPKGTSRLVETRGFSPRGAVYSSERQNARRRRLCAWPDSAVPFGLPGLAALLDVPAGSSSFVFVTLRNAGPSDAGRGSRSRHAAASSTLESNAGAARS